MCTCATCAQSLQMIAWYGQVPGDVLGRRTHPYLRQWERGVDVRALLRSKTFFTTAFTMRYVQWALLVLALGQLYLSMVLPQQLMSSTSTATCAVTRVTPHSLLNGQPVSASANASDWEFGLLSNKCIVPGGKISKQGTARVLSFAEAMTFDGFYLISHSAQSEVGRDPSSFILECLPGGEVGSEVTIAASGSCGWFATFLPAARVVNPPPSQWQTSKSHLTGKDERRITHDYSKQQIVCKLPLLLDRLSVFVAGFFQALSACQALFFENSGVLGIKFPLHTFATGGLLQSVATIMMCFLSWKPDHVLILFHVGRILSLIALIAERFPEEHIFVFGLYTSLLGVWVSLSTLEGTTRTAFYVGDVLNSTWTPRSSILFYIYMLAHTHANLHTNIQPRRLVFFHVCIYACIYKPT